MLLPLVLYRVGRSRVRPRSGSAGIAVGDPDLGGLLGGDEHYAILRPNRIGLAPLHGRRSKNWPGRAAGVFKQPVVNGWLLALGLAIAMLLLSRRSEPTWRRWFAFVVAIACGYGIYLTHTRDGLDRRRGRAHHRCTHREGIPQGVHRSDLPGGFGGRGQLVRVHQLRPEGRWRGLDERSAGSAQRRSDGALGVRPETRRRLGHRPVPRSEHLPPPAVGTGRTVDPRIRHRRAFARTGNPGRGGRDRSRALDLRGGAGHPPAVDCLPDSAGPRSMWQAAGGHCDHGARHPHLRRVDRRPPICSIFQCSLSSCSPESRSAGPIATSGRRRPRAARSSSL